MGKYAIKCNEGWLSKDGKILVYDIDKKTLKRAKKDVKNKNCKLVDVSNKV